MFGIFKRLAALERTKSATIADLQRMNERLIRLEARVFPTPQVSSQGLYHGAIVAVGSGTIEPVKIKVKGTDDLSLIKFKQPKKPGVKRKTVKPTDFKKAKVKFKVNVGRGGSTK